MTLSTGTISLSQVNTELGYSASATISLNDAAVRALAGVSSGTISMSNLQGKSAGNPFTLAFIWGYQSYYNNGREQDDEMTSGGSTPSPSSVYINGAQLRVMNLQYGWGDGGGPVYSIVTLQLEGSLGQSHFTSLSGNGYTKLTSQTAFYYNYGSWTEWRWTTSDPYTNVVTVPRYVTAYPTAVNKSLSWA